LAGSHAVSAVRRKAARKLSRKPFGTLRILRALFAGGKHMDVVLKFVTLATVIVGAIAVYIAVRNNSMQMAAQIFLAYSDRIRAIGLRGAADADDPRAVLESTYLMFEFYELRRRGYVARSIWSIWESDMVDLMNRPAYCREWGSLRYRFVNHPHFVDWVTRHQRKTCAHEDFQEPDGEYAAHLKSVRRS
jgi:hypothetical protein